MLQVVWPRGVAVAMLQHRLERQAAKLESYWQTLDSWYCNIKMPKLLLWMYRHTGIYLDTSFDFLRPKALQRSTKVVVQQGAISYVIPWINLRLEPWISFSGPKPWNDWTLKAQGERKPLKKLDWRQRKENKGQNQKRNETNSKTSCESHWKPAIAWKCQKIKDFKSHWPPSLLDLCRFCKFWFNKFDLHLFIHNQFANWLAIFNDSCASAVFALYSNLNRGM